MWNKIGYLVNQPEGFKAFIPLPFPIQEEFRFSSQQQLLHGEAMRLIGKLDGISQLLPDSDLFIRMFIGKEAASSSQIEGTQATLIDAIEAEIIPKNVQAPDVEDIILYVHALREGTERFKTLPISVRFIKELHSNLMTGACTTQKSFPGEFRYTQNWIGGMSPSNALFVPPPVHEIPRAMGDIETFINADDDTYPPLIKAALLHAQFETVHPFTDGNGRTGRLLITLFLWKEKLLQLPLLYLSDFFKKNKELYCERLQGYHSNPARVDKWIDFFLEGIIATANSAISTASDITHLREKDMEKTLKLGKIAATTAVEVLRNLYQQPIVDVIKIMEWTGTKTRAGAQKIIDRLIELKILSQKLPRKNYGRIYEYRNYIKILNK